jgi:hypothetical protein
MARLFLVLAGELIAHHSSASCIARIGAETNHVTRHTSHVTRHSSSLWRPHAAQILHDSVIAINHGVSQGSMAVAAAQGVRSTTRMRSARESSGHLFLAVTSALCSTSGRQVSSLSLERCRGVSPLQTRSKSNGPPQCSRPYFIIIQRGITICSGRSRLRRSSAEPRR